MENESQRTGKASLKRLQFCNFKLDFLLNLTLAINENLPIEEILQKFQNILQQDLNIGKVLLYIYNEKWERALSSGVPRALEAGIRVPADLELYTQTTSLINTLNPNLSQFDLLVPVAHHGRALAYLLIGDIEEERAGLSPTIKHLHFIHTLTNIVAVAIENRNLYSQTLRQEVLRNELDLAARMQAMLIPSHSSLPNNARLQASAYYLPHFEVSGDYYDVIPLHGGKYAFCIADVSGKGMSAALLMSNFQANIHALMVDGAELAEVVHKLNHIVMKNANGEKFITLFLGEYDPESRRIAYVNAGHNPPILYQAGSRSLKTLQSGCAGIGMLDQIPAVRLGEEYVSPGSRLLLFTDGTTEQENDQGDEFGVVPMENELLAGVPLDGVIDNVVSQLEAFKGSASYSDDITLLAFEFPA